VQISCKYRVVSFSPTRWSKVFANTGIEMAKNAAATPYYLPSRRSSRRSQFRGFVAASRSQGSSSHLAESCRSSLGRSLISRLLSNVESRFTIFRPGRKASSRHLRARIGDPAALIGLNQPELSLLRTVHPEKLASNSQVKWPREIRASEK